MQTEWGEMGGEGASSFWELVLGLLLFGDRWTANLAMRWLSSHRNIDDPRFQTPIFFHCDLIPIFHRCLPATRYR